jgi:hypothetical protein
VKSLDHGRSHDLANRAVHEEQFCRDLAQAGQARGKARQQEGWMQLSRFALEVEIFGQIRERPLGQDDWILGETGRCSLGPGAEPAGTGDLFSKLCEQGIECGKIGIVEQEDWTIEASCRRYQGFSGPTGNALQRPSHGQNDVLVISTARQPNGDTGSIGTGSNSR